MVDAVCGLTVGLTQGLGNKAFQVLRSSARDGGDFFIP